MDLPLLPGSVSQPRCWDQSGTADEKMPLLYALRNDLGMSNPKFGCGLAQCGACTVHVDGTAVRSCRLPLPSA